MVAEPKPHQTGRKRQNMAKTGNDWDYYYDSYYTSTVFPVGPPRLVPPLKRQRLMTSSPRNNKSAASKCKEISQIDQLKAYSNPDILICGNCRDMFTELHELLDHKKTYCKLRFTCKCDNLTKNKSQSNHSSASLLCMQCKEAFQNAWDLMVHAQAAHMMNIYEINVPSVENCNSPPISPRDSSTPDKDKTEPSLMDGEDENGHEHDNDFIENGRFTVTPDSGHSRIDKELEDLMDVEATAKPCIMHALSIVSTPAGQTCASPPSVAAVAPIPDSDWKHTHLSPKVNGECDKLEISNN